MKKILMPLLIVGLSNCFLVKLASAQTLSPSVMPSSGGYYAGANGSLSWTVGETITPTFSSANNKLTQGFQQPEVQVRTGATVNSVCAGGAISVPFTSSGIMGGANVFTAQLSNASGSFASPVSIGSLTGNASAGNINANIPAGTPLGSGYRIRVVSSLPVFIGPDNGANINVVNTCAVTVNLILYLQGYYDGGELMRPVLANQGIGFSATLVDTLQVELRNEFNPSVVVGSVSALLHTDGTVSCSFPVVAGNYYLVVKHRNTVQTWSASPVALGVIPMMYNFSTAPSQAYGNNLTQVDTGIWALYSGDINQDENDDLLDLGMLEADITNFQYGYFATDLNGDGNVDLLDSPMLEASINNFVYSNHP